MMTQHADLTQRIDQLEAQVAPLAESAKSLKELRDELAPRVNEAVQALIHELADVEADFQLEDLIHLIKNAMRNVKNLNYALDQLKNLIDFLVITEPLLKTTVPQIIYYFDELEQKGVFRLVAMGLEVVKRLGKDYSPEQMDQIGNGVVRLANIICKLISSNALDLLDKTADLPDNIDLAGARPVGLWGLMGALSDPKVKTGMGVVLEFTRGLAEMKS